MAPTFLATLVSKPYSARPFASLALVVAIVLGPACHDATGPDNSIVPVPSFSIVSGNAQTATAGSELAQPLVARATTSTGTPIAGLTVSFVITQGGGHLYAGTGVTNSSGDVKDYWTLGTVAGPHTVEVRAVDPTTGVKNSYATFTATATAGPAAIIKASAGDGQTAFTRALVAIKPAVLVTDVFGNPVSGVSIAFAVTAGGGSLSGSPVSTNASGIAAVGSYWRLGRGPGENKLTATKTGLTGSPVTFSATAKFGFKAIATGSDHACGLDAAGDVYCWGYNGVGTIGDGTLIDRRAPVRSAPQLLSSLSAGGFHSCGLAAGKAYCWGWNAYGQVGDGTTSSAQTSVAVAGANTFVKLALGYGTTCGMTSTGGLLCWGNNADGEFGNGTTTSSSVPVVAAGGLTFKSVYVGSYHTCALTSTGNAWCWGRNVEGQLGDATTTSHLSPTLVSGGLAFTSLALGDRHTCGIVASGLAYCWGYNFSGQLGNGSSGSGVLSSSPGVVYGGLAFAQIAASGTMSCGITTSGDAYCWGSNASGQLGTGNVSPSPIPTSVVGGHKFSSISTGVTGTGVCALPAEGGSPFCWGYNAYGQLGNGSVLNSSQPTEVVPPPIP